MLQKSDMEQRLEEKKQLIVDLQKKSMVITGNISNLFFLVAFFGYLTYSRMYSPGSLIVDVEIRGCIDFIQKVVF